MYSVFILYEGLVRLRAEWPKPTEVGAQGRPNICATQGAPGVPSSMVLEYIHSVSVVPSILVLTVSEPFLEPFLGILTDFDPIFPISSHGKPPKSTSRAVRRR